MVMSVPLSLLDSSHSKWTWLCSEVAVVVSVQPDETAQWTTHAGPGRPGNTGASGARPSDGCLASASLSNLSAPRLVHLTHKPAVRGCHGDRLAFVLTIVTVVIS